MSILQAIHDACDTFGRHPTAQHDVISGIDIKRASYGYCLTTYPGGAGGVHNALSINLVGKHSFFTTTPDLVTFQRKTEREPAPKVQQWRSIPQGNYQMFHTDSRFGLITTLCDELSSLLYAATPAFQMGDTTGVPAHLTFKQLLSRTRVVPAGIFCTGHYMELLDQHGDGYSVVFDASREPAHADKVLYRSGMYQAVQRFRVHTVPEDMGILTVKELGHFQSFHDELLKLYR